MLRHAQFESSDLESYEKATTTSKLLDVLKL